MTRARSDAPDAVGTPTRALDVVWFNYPTYLASLAAIAIAGAILRYARLPTAIRAAIGAGGLLAAWWLAASTAVSAWVFQLSGITRWRWLPACFEAAPDAWLNITSGFDDTTPALARLFASAEGLSIDIFDESAEHDGAILRARASRPPAGPSVEPGRPLPLTSASRDGVFLLMAAHELRDTGVRRHLLAEVARVLRPAGRLVMVEHLRTGLNAAAFGPGVLHFCSRDVWLDDVAAAGLRLISERPLTPFATAWTLGPRDASSA